LDTNLSWGDGEDFRLRGSPGRRPWATSARPGPTGSSSASRAPSSPSCGAWGSAVGSVPT